MQRTPRRRVRRIHRQVRRPRPPHPHDRDNQLRTALQAQPHHRLRARTPAGQQPGQPPRPRIQLPVTDMHIPAHHRHRIRSAGRPRRDQLRHRSLRNRGRGVVPPGDHLGPLGRAPARRIWCSRACGPAATAASTRPSRTAMPCAVSSSNKSAAADTDPRSPPRRPSAPVASDTTTSRSNLACAGPAATGVAVIPGSPPPGPRQCQCSARRA